jgi:hypothetical protein
MIERNKIQRLNEKLKICDLRNCNFQASAPMLRQKYVFPPKGRQAYRGKTSSHQFELKNELLST